MADGHREVPTADRTGVLVMAHGSPSSAEEIEAFYTRIRRGSAPSEAQLAELRSRYDAIGGTSPLARRTEAQVTALREVLDEHGPGHFVVRFGAKHTEPFIEDAARDLLAIGPRRVITLVLTPHWSSRGSGEYLERAAGALEGSLPVFPIRQWWDEPALIELLAGRVRSALGPEGALVLFTAHSLPQKVLALGDPYAEQVAASASAVAAAAGVDDWRVAWQSAGRTPEPWLGPDLLDVLREVGDQGVRDVVICPIGFVADHLEVLYDIDIEARKVARCAGVHLVRTESLNDDPRFIEVLADLVIRVDREHGTAPRP